MFKHSIPLLGLVTLAACGGSTASGPTVIPISSEGFATATSRITTGDSFEVSNARRVVGTTDGILSADTQDIKFSIDSGGDKVTVVIAGEPYILDLNPDVEGEFEYNDGDNSVFVGRLGPQYDDAEIVEVFSFVEGQLNTSNLVIGFDTDPQEVSAATGSAEFNGEIFVAVRNNEDGFYFDGFGEGPVTLDVDFDDSRISGDFSLSNRSLPGSDFAVPTSSFKLDEADIIGNGFNGTISEASGNIGGAISAATYDGRFYGENASNAGGQISATFAVDGQEQPSFIEGAFVAAQ